MDIFDQYLFDEIKVAYEKDNLTNEDYEEIYERFCNIDYLTEVRPYLLTMKFFGLGTVAEKEAVLTELKANLKENDYILNGLYYDFQLSENSNNVDYLKNLYKMVEKGYTNKFTKEKSNIEKAKEQFKKSASQKSGNREEKIQSNEDVIVKSISFECNDYSGWNFTAGDIDYLHAKVYINPIHGKKHIKVSSQIFLNDEEFSDIFYNEYDIDSNTGWIRTTGWGNKNFTCYRNNTYKWVIKIDEKTIFSECFYMYDGKLDENGPVVRDVKLFASKATGALEADRCNYRTTFDAKTLENIYFKFFIDEPGIDMNVKIFIKVNYLEDNSVFKDNYFLFRLDADTIACWQGIGFSKAGKWKKGLYQYSAYIGKSTVYEGTFTVN